MVVRRQQAHSLAKRWQQESKRFDTFIASPLVRAKETAEIITAALNLPLEFDPIWMERNNGRLAGLRPEEALVQYPRPSFSRGRPEPMPISG